jgi:Holliday junction resolvase RusA-like endonuclease
MIDIPFAPPPDIVLDLPRPPSVNRTRRLDKSALPKIAAWTRTADAMTTAAWSGGRRPKHVLNRFEVIIVLPETTTSADLDNTPKKIIDYAKRLGLIVDDGPKYMRKVTIVWGEAPEGCRLILRPHE